MSTILMAFLILAVTIILPWIFIIRHKKTLKKQRHENYRKFSLAGSERELSFSRQEIVQNKFIGFDGIQQVLMIAELDNDCDILCIALRELTQCRIDKVYYNEIDKEKILKEIRLEFHFIDNRTPAHIIFYSHNNDSVYLMADLETKAKEWQIAISKMILKPVTFG